LEANGGGGRSREHSSCSFKDRMTLKIQCCNLLSKGVMSDNMAVYPLPPCHYPKPNAFPKIPHDTNYKLMLQQTHTKISAVNDYCLSQENGKLNRWKSSVIAHKSPPTTKLLQMANHQF
jgi:hypothetical protein